jgi:hypothetical protein
MIPLRQCLAVALILIATAVEAKEPKRPNLPPVPRFAGEIIEVKNGANEVDLNGDSVPDAIYKFHGQNWNAHSYDTYIAVIHNIDGEYKIDRWETVRIDTHGLPKRLIFGHDTVTDKPHDGQDLIRVVLFARERGKDDETVVAMYIASRSDFRESLYDLVSVEVVRYELTPNDIVGMSAWYFQPTHYSRSKALYCNAGLALVKEFGFPELPDFSGPLDLECIGKPSKKRR